MEKPLYTETDQALVIRLSGEIVMDLAANLKAELTLLIDATQKPEVVCNMRRVDFMDSSGVGLLIGIRRLCQDKGKAFSVADPSPAIRKLISVLRLTEFFAIAPADAS
ncbi:anti-sigma-factor antagonist [Solidesulfovibrio fructosivorans JJ]]|uniref:Anti-sigma factor antagonist n=1 Tax=Solidesulfovibrio fructosivorans JJ] TaxID=596151 RepID=E1K061_SOLFR|nr:STAS domain-containing protein [Solidesulfovibrio fructosivorans]EFL49979.1 anti-sigma-factor antagonist [Solidesulfovibrio fructosivorans JJ]]